MDATHKKQPSLQVCNGILGAITVCTVEIEMWNTLEQTKKLTCCTYSAYCWNTLNKQFKLRIREDSKYEVEQVEETFNIYSD